MKGDERDDLQRRQTYASEVLADAMRRLLTVAETPEHKRERERELYAAFPAPHRPFHGARGVKTLAAAIPGFAGLWTQVVPERALLHLRARDGKMTDIVVCECGHQTVLDEVTPMRQCEGGRMTPDGELDLDGCTRFFLATETDVRVKRFELAAAA